MFRFLKKSGRSRQAIISSILFLSIIFVFFGCEGSGGGDNDPQPGNIHTLPNDIEILDEGLISRNGQEVILALRTDASGHKWFVACDRSGEAVGAIYSEDTSGTNPDLLAAVYALPDGGGGFTVGFGVDGLPNEVVFSDGYYATLDNYTTTHVNISIFDESGNQIVSEEVILNEHFLSLTGLITEAQNISSAQPSAGVNASYLAFKLASLVVSSLSCAVALAAQSVDSTFTAARVVTVSCLSAGSGLVSTISYIAGYDDLESEAGTVSTGLDVFSCVAGNIRGAATDAGDLASCLSLVATFAGYHYDKCGVRELRSYKACHKDNVYWFNDCDYPFVIEELCPCGCEDGSCKPFDRCDGNGAIQVQISSDIDRCEPGETIAFWASVSGGDSTTYIYEWRFGSGGSSYLQSVAHMFPAAGVYPIHLVVTDDEGNVGYGVKKVQVGNQAPVIEVEDAGSEFEYGEDIVFTCEALDPEDGELSGGSIIWSNGDTGNTATFTGLSADMHTITVTATDSEERATTNSFVINVVRGTCYPIKWDEDKDTPADSFLEVLFYDEMQSELSYVEVINDICLLTTLKSYSEDRSNRAWSDYRAQKMADPDLGIYKTLIRVNTDHFMILQDCINGNAYHTVLNIRFYKNTIIETTNVRNDFDRYTGQECSQMICQPLEFATQAHELAMATMISRINTKMAGCIED